MGFLIHDSCIAEISKFPYNISMKSTKTIDQLRTTLSSVGLSDTEAAFYLASAQLGKASVRKIASQAGLNRSSAYAIFAALKTRGIVSGVTKQGKVLVEPIAPKKLLALQQDRLATLEKQMDVLSYLFRVAQQEPGVKFYEGAEGMKAVLKEILEETKDVCIFGDGDAFKRAIPDWTETYADRRIASGIRARMILRGTPEAVASIKRSRLTKGKKHELTMMRVLPEAMNIKGGFDLYGNKVVLYSFDEKTIAVVVESSMISAMMRSIFDILWSLAETYERTLLR